MAADSLHARMRWVAAIAALVTLASLLVQLFSRGGVDARTLPDARGLPLVGSAPPTAPRELVVVSMHRSGSSFLTGLLFLCGAYPGDPHALVWVECRENQGCGRWNGRGYYEQLAMIALNDALLRYLPDAGVPLEASANLTNFTGEAARFLGDLRAGSGGHVLVVKDPRLCLTLPFWLPMLSSPVVLVPMRNPVAVARSLLIRDATPLPEGLLKWEEYVVSAMRAIVAHKLPFLIVDTAELQRDVPRGMHCIVDTLTAGGVAGLAVPPNIATFFERDIGTRHAWERPGNDTAQADAKDVAAAATPFQQFLFNTLRAMSLNLRACPDPRKSWDLAARAIPGGRAFWTSLRTEPEREHSNVTWG